MSNQEIPDNLAIAFPDSLEDEDGLKVDFSRFGAAN